MITLNYKYFNFPNNVIKIGGCIERSLSYYDLEIVNHDKTLKALIDNLKHNNIDFTIKHFDYHDYLSKRGLFIYRGNKVSHVGVFDKGIYYDSYNHGKPDFLIVFK